MSASAGRTPAVLRGSLPRLRGGADLRGLAVGILASLLVVGFMARGMTGLAAAAVVALPVVLVVIARPQRGLYVALGLILLVPYTLWVGVPQADIVRLSAMGAVLALFCGAQQAHERVRFTLVDGAAVALVLLAVASWQLNEHPPGALATTVNFLTPLALYVAARRFAADAGDALFWILLVGGALASLSVFYEFFVAHQAVFVDKKAYLWNAGVGALFRPGGVFGSPPAAATILAMTSLCGLRFLPTVTGIRRKVVWLCLGGSLLAMGLTLTRAPILGFLAGGAVFVLLLRPARWGRLVFGAMVAALVLTIVVLPKVGATSWYQEAVVRKGNLSERQGRWALAGPLITDSAEHFLFGRGINSLVVGTADLPGPVDPKIPLGSAVRSPHSQYVRTLLEEGLVGLLIVLAWLLGTVAVGIRGAARLPAQRPLLAAGTGAIVAALVSGLVGDVLRHPPTFAVLAVIAGVVVGRSRLTSAPVEDDDESSLDEGMAV